MDIGVAENDEQREATYRFLNDEISAEHARLMEEARSTDTKATVVAGFAAAAVSFLLDDPGGTCRWAGLVCCVASLGTALAAMWPRDWDGIGPRELGPFSDAAPMVVIGRVASSKMSVYQRNRVRVRIKGILWVASVAFLAGGVGLSVWSTIEEATR